MGIYKSQYLKHIYHKMLGAKLLRITVRKTYKVFSIAGQLYLQFLKEKPFVPKEAAAAVAEEKKVESAIEPIQTSVSAIDPMKCIQIARNRDAGLKWVKTNFFYYVLIAPRHF